MLDEKPRRALCTLIARFGPDLRNDALRCEALLRDDCGGKCECEIQVLLAALRIQVPEALLERPGSMPWQVLLCLQGERLHGDCGLARDKAIWAVESWALALGVIGQAQIAAQQMATDTPQLFQAIGFNEGARLKCFIIPAAVLKVAVVLAGMFILLITAIPSILPPLVGGITAGGIIICFFAPARCDFDAFFEWLIHGFSCAAPAHKEQSCNQCQVNCDCFIVMRRRCNGHERTQQNNRG